MPSARPSAAPAKFEEAVRWFRERVPMTEAEYADLESDARHRSFTVAGVAQLDLVTDVWRAIVRAVDEGTTLEDFRDEVGRKLEAAWGEDDGHRLETIFRTNVQAAYSAGRYEQMNDPAIRKARPYKKLSVVLDGRTSDICEALADTVLPADDPFWETHNPPLHFGCRDAVLSLTEEQATEAGIDEEAPNVDPDDGFGHAPGHREWKPDLAEYPAELADVARAALIRGERS